MARGRTKKPQTVTLTMDELKMLGEKLGYQDNEELIDDIAKGMIAPPSGVGDAVPRSEGSSPARNGVATAANSGVEVRTPVKEAAEEKQGTPNSKASWADVVEEEELKVKAEEAKQMENEKQETPVLSWLDIVRGNRAQGNGQDLEFVQPGDEVVMSEEEWKEGERMWKFTLAAKFGKSRPAYAEVMKW